MGSKALQKCLLETQVKVCNFVLTWFVGVQLRNVMEGQKYQNRRETLYIYIYYPLSILQCGKMF